MDTSQDFEVVWVPSQSPALQALMTEAENDRRTRPSTPIHQPTSWTYPLSARQSSRSSMDTSSPPPLSGSSSFSSLSLAPRGSDPSASRRVHPPSAVQRHPLASSASSANRPPRHSARPRSSSHSTAASKGIYTPKDDEPEALHFIELLKHASKQVDINSEKKERAVLEKEKGEEKGREREHSRGRSGVNNRTLIKTSSASVITGFAKASEKTSNASTSARKPEFGGRALTKTASLSVPGAHLVSGKSTPTSLPSPNLNCDLKPASGPRLPAGASNASIANPSTAHKGNGKAKTNDDDNAMQDVIDLVETDSEWERPISVPSLRADTTMYMQVDDEESDSDSEMDVSFFKPEPQPQPRAPKPKLQPPQPTCPSAPTQHARIGPPPLGMRRAPQLQPSQYSSTQAPKGVTVPRFKPPSLANVGGTAHKNGSRSKPAPAVTAASSRPPLPPPRGNAAQVPVVATTAQTSKDPDSSFDMSFDVDADALEEAMKAYD